MWDRSKPECEHFLKANWDWSKLTSVNTFSKRTEIDLNQSVNTFSMRTEIDQNESVNTFLMRTEIDQNECEHFLKENPLNSKIILHWFCLIFKWERGKRKDEESWKWLYFRKAKVFGFFPPCLSNVLKYC